MHTQILAEFRQRTALAGNSTASLAALRQEYYGLLHGTPPVEDVPARVVDAWAEAVLAGRVAPPTVGRPAATPEARPFVSPTRVRAKFRADWWALNGRALTEGWRDELRQQISEAAYRQYHCLPAGAYLSAADVVRWASCAVLGHRTASGYYTLPARRGERLPC